MKKIIYLIFLCLFAQLIFADQLAMYPFKSQQQAQRFQHLTYQLRCLVCQNQTIAESDATLAGDLRSQIADKIRAGQSDQEIIQYLVTRYGDFILYNPPMNSQTWLLWLAPFLLLVVFLSFLIIRLKTKPKENIALTVSDKEKIKAFLEKSS